MTGSVAEQDALLALFDELLTLTAQAREQRLLNVDNATAQLLRAMLAVDTAPEKKLPEVPFASIAQSWEGLEPGQRLGSFELLRLVGRGGMGQVYLGRRVGEVQQQAAIKVQLPLVATDETLRRFRLERQILAGLEHPAIARLIECGEDAQGRPYYAMEWIDGVTIDQYCAEHKLDLKSRLRLFAQLCEGVDYAHRHLVVHRDIKSSNVMVTRDGQPKLLDFGIAKALDAHTAAMDSTATHARFFSPNHAAPEQVRGQAISIGCDVYALGVLLYELLSGVRPYALDGLSPREIEEQICELTPPLPSAQLSALQLGDSAAAERLAMQRGGTRTSTLINTLRGDLDRIVLHALRKRPQERYASAAELRADIQRFLRGEAVLARGMGRGYRVRKFIGRHRLATTLASGFVSALSVFAVLLWLQAGALRQERDEVARQLHRAEIERARAEQVTAFIEQTFAQADPSQALGEKLTVSDVLDIGARTLDFAQFDDPQLRHRMQLTLARVMQSLGRDAEAAALAAQVDAQLPALQRLASLRLHAESVSYQGDDAKAIALSERALTLLSSTLDVPKPDQGRTWLMRGRVLRGANDKEGALAAAERAIALLDPSVEDQFVDHAQAQRLRARVLMTLDQIGPARTQLQALLDSQQRKLQKHHPAMLDTLRLLAYAYTTMGELDKAESLLAQQIDSSEKVFGADSLQRAFALNGRAILRTEQRNLQGARADYGETLRILRGRLNPDHAMLALVVANSGELELLLGEPKRAERHYREAVAIALRSVDRDGENTAYLRLGLGSALSDLGKLDQAEPEIAAGLRGLSAIKGLTYALAVGEKALWLARKGRAAESRTLWREALPILARETQPHSPARQRLERSLRALGSS